MDRQRNGLASGARIISAHSRGGVQADIDLSPALCRALEPQALNLRDPQERDRLLAMIPDLPTAVVALRHVTRKFAESGEHVVLTFKVLSEGNQITLNQLKRHNAIAERIVVTEAMRISRWIINQHSTITLSD
jgi:hypothetical protein